MCACIIHACILYGLRNLIASVLQGSTLPFSTCDVASTDFYSVNDSCTRAAQNLFSEINFNSAIASLFMGDCPGRFEAYVNACREIFDDKIVQLATRIFSISQATNDDGTPCLELIPSFLSMLNDEGVNVVAIYIHMYVCD